MELLILSFFLSLFGFFNLFGINYLLSIKHLFNIFIGFLFYFFIKKQSFNFFRTNSRFFYWFFLLMLIFTFIFGNEIKGSRRWLDFGFFNFQSSEFLKPFFVLFLSDYFSKKSIFENNFFFIFKAFFYFFIPFFIIFKQPDLANSIVYFVIFFVLLFFSKISKKHLSYFFIFIFSIFPFIYFFLKPYQKARIIAFLNPHFDIQGASYNILQSLISIGSGGFFGKGLGFGSQSRLNFLPESTTDFAFASLVEQFGFFGGFFVILFYFLIIYFLFKKTVFYFYKKDNDNQMNFLFCLGLLVYVIFHFFVNVGMNLGLLPVAGVVLPFISYGGSAIISLMIFFALVP